MSRMGWAETPWHKEAVPSLRASPMPFDVAAEPAPVALSLSRANDLELAFATARPPEAAWAAANPDRALAFLMVAPQPCEALDALLAA